MNSIDKLINNFSKFPGIGPRQAKRFAYFLLSRDEKFTKELSENISNLKKDVKKCGDCFRFFPDNQYKDSDLCSICLDENRDDSAIILVSSDVDFENIERAKTFNGKYFILGGSVPILEKEPEKRVRASELLKTLEKKALNGNLEEVILAFNPNPEGDNTSDYIKNLLETLKDKFSLKISTLGKGLSTGAELEYSDSETIKYALRNKQ